MPRCRRVPCAIAAFALAMCLATSALAAAPVARLRGAQAAEVVRGAGGEKAEIFRFEPGVAPALIGSSASEALQIDSWPLEPGKRGAVTLARRDVYSPDAVIYRVDAT